MEDLIERFTLECRTNKSGKLKRFKPNSVKKESYTALKLLDNNFILYRYPSENRFYSEDMIDRAFQVLVNINSLVEEVLNLSNRDKCVIREVELEYNFSRQKTQKNKGNT